MILLDLLAQVTATPSPEGLLSHAMTSIVGSGPIAIVMGFALYYQTKKLERVEEKVEKLHDDYQAKLAAAETKNEALHAEVLSVFRGIGGVK